MRWKCVEEKGARAEMELASKRGEGDDESQNSLFRQFWVSLAGLSAKLINVTSKPIHRSLVHG